MIGDLVGGDAQQPGGEPAVLPPEPTFTPDRDSWAAHTGEYQTSDGTLRVYREDDQLLGFVAGVNMEFIPLSDTTFIMLSNLSALDEVPAEFQRQADGSVVLQFLGRPFAVRK